MRFYDPLQGSVSLDGHDLKDLNVCKLRDLIGVVSQEPILFDGTLEENILLGNEHATREDVIRCCRMANAYDFVQKLPEGLYTRVGERGIQLVSYTNSIEVFFSVRWSKTKNSYC
jgi:ATP-binding cassette subfamily B (MDR/TAP) protein 1